jgi:putative two-component system response regulator
MMKAGAINMAEDKKKTILLVEDEAIIAMTERMALEKYGYAIIVANRGEKAIEIIKTNKEIDLVLMDNDLGEGLDGPETATTILQLRVLPIVFLSSHTDIEIVEKIEKITSYGYVVKDSGITILDASIKMAFKLFEAKAEVRKKNDELVSLNRELIATIQQMEEANQDLIDTNQELTATDENLWHTLEVLKKNEAQLRTTQEATISSMAILSEFRDTDTGSHIQRTKLYVKLMLEKIGSGIPYPSEMVELIWHSAPLHDIGKIAIPDSILLKTARLTPEEFEIMKKHALYGSDAIRRTQEILEENSFLNFAAEIAEFHHEKWDGSGYPHGISGLAIPLSARIMAIADVYDACISERPYKTPIPHEKVVQIIQEGGGTHFDPELVRIFVENHEEFNLIGIKYKDLVVL